MKSKIFFFNKTIFKKNFSHYWPLWVFFLTYLIFILPVNLWKTMSTGYYDETLSKTTIQYIAIDSVLEQALNPLPVFLFASAAVLAVFSYLYSARNANMIHSLPVNRLELFLTNFLSGILWLVIPELLAFIIAVFVGIATGVTSLQYLFFWLLCTMGITFFAASFSTFLAMMTGYLPAMPAYCVIGNYLYVGCLYIVSTIIGNICYGISQKQAWRPGKLCVLSPLYYLNNNVRCNVVWNQSTRQVTEVQIRGGCLVAGYTVTAVLLLAAAYHIYKNRQMETAGDIVAVTAIKPLFRWGAAMCGGFLLGNSLLGMLLPADRIKSDFPLLFIGVLVSVTICFWAAEMLLQKNFRVFKRRRMIEWGVAAAASVFILGIFKLDVFGIEKNIPKPEEISCGYIYMDYPICFSGEDVEKMIAIHNQVIESKEEYLLASETGAELCWATFRYYLRNGEVFDRSYPLPVTEEYLADKTAPPGQILSMEEEPENLKKYVFGKEYEANEYYSGYMDTYDENKNYGSYRFSEEELECILDAIMKDIEEGNYSRYQLYEIYNIEDEYLNAISISYINKKGIWNDSEYYFMYDYNMMGEMVNIDTEAGTSVGMGSAYISFGKKCTNLIKELKELGIVNEERKLYTYEEYGEW